MREACAGRFHLGRTDEEGQAASWGDEGRGGGEDGFEVLHGAQGDEVERGSGEGFGTGVLYIDVCQCKRAGDFAEEGGLLVVGLDQGQGDLRGPEFQREAGESSAGADVGDGVAAVSSRGAGRLGVSIGNRWRAANRLSPKWRGTMSSGSRMAVRLMRAFQRRSISMYVDILWRASGVRR